MLSPPGPLPSTPQEAARDSALRNSQESVHALAVSPAHAPTDKLTSARQGDAQLNYGQLLRILQDLRTMLEQRNNALRALRVAQHEAIRRLIVISAKREPGGIGHCLRVGAISALLADALGQPPAWCDMLFDAAPVHDIGNLCIPDMILYKAGALSAREWRVVQDHPLAGARMLDSPNNPIAALAAEIALNHHEKWDGSGYPAARQGVSIPLAARIVAVADFVDSLGFTSTFRDTLPTEQVFELLELASGAQFDPHVVRAMHSIRPRLSSVHALAASWAPKLANNLYYPFWWHEA